jgi:hypothetical protein
MNPSARAETASLRMGIAVEMDMHISGGTHFESASGDAEGLAALRRRLRHWCSQLSFGVRSPVWPGLLAALIIFGMLLAFHQVVREAVQQSESRHQATASLAEATWRCKLLRGVDASGSCLLQLNLAARSPTLLPARTPQALRESGVEYAFDSKVD